jgi:hypothetical protein
MEQNNVGLFIDTTQIWDEYLQASQGEIDSRELFLRLYQNINKIAIALNLKDSGLYSQTEFVNGQQWCPINEITNFTGVVASNDSKVNADPRQVYRKIVFCGALLNAAAKTIPHGIVITDTTKFVRMYGAANTINTIPTKLYKPIPCTGVDPIDLLVDETNITLITTTNLTAFNEVWVVLEYLKL